MEVEGVQPCKRSRVGNGASKIAHKEQQQHQDDDEADGEAMGGGAAQLRSWPHHHQHASSRIFRVSRASGGKDRHSKVLTAKGLRDRRVRLSVSTAIQFYDLQDRLGFDQPSKAVEWLINAASTAIAKLPALDGPFPEPPTEPQAGKYKQVEEQMPEADADADPDPDPDAEPSYNQQHLSLTKSGCSSTSDTSKGSVLSLSRSENRTKARERARERAARDKEKDRADNVHVAAHHHALNPSLNSTSSFTELLTGGGGGGNGTAAQDTSSANCIQKQHRHVPPATATADYFGQAGFFAQAHTQKQHQLPPFGSQPHFVNSSSMAMLPFGIAAGAADHPEMQQISFMQDSLIPVTAVASPADYNLNFSISSSGLAGLNRGTLQSNSASQLPHHHQLQRLSSQVDGSNLPFFFGAAAPTSAENQFPAGLQLYYGDFKGKGKN